MPRPTPYWIKTTTLTAQLRNLQERKKKITVRCTPSKQTTKQRGRRELFTPWPEPEADSDTSDADETLQYDYMYNTDFISSSIQGAAI